jgi:hypothetical protein
MSAASPDSLFALYGMAAGEGERKGNREQRNTPKTKRAAFATRRPNVQYIRATFMITLYTKHCNQIMNIAFKRMRSRASLGERRKL